MIKSLPWSYHPPEHAPEHRLRYATASLLRTVSRVLIRLARRLATKEASNARHAPVGHLEFYAEAGAPEGALYADGVLIGYLRGIKRL